MTDLNQLMSGLAIHTDTDCEFSQELDNTDFTIFEHISSIGFFTWDPMGSRYKSLMNISSSSDILCHIDFDGVPDKLKPISSLNLPRRIDHFYGREKWNKFPYGRIDIACLHVAAKRGVDFEKVDFVFGGSILQMLATKNVSDPYIATKIPGTQCVLVGKSNKYRKNLGDFGFQFERLVTGQNLRDTSNWKQTEHMHLTKVGDSTVLFKGEVDAIDSYGPVEVKSSNRRYFGTKVMFQMISNGSVALCHGEKSGGVVTRVTRKSLSRVAGDALGNKLQRLEDNIVNGMKEIKKQIGDEGIYNISFVNGTLKLVRKESRRNEVLPREDIVKELLLN